MFRFSYFVALLLAVPAWAQSPVSEPTGSLTGAIDGAEFDLPVICEEAGNWLVIRSHDISFDMNRPSDVDTAVTIALAGRNMSVQAFAGGKRYEFGSFGVKPGRQFSFTGTIKGDAGSYGVALEADCDG